MAGFEVIPEGKTASSGNSYVHGMTAKAVVLTNENPQAFINLAESYHAKFEPTDDVERDIIDDMTVSRWRLRRVWQNEKALFDLELDRQSKKIAAQYDKIGHNSCSALAFRALADESKVLQLRAGLKSASVEPVQPPAQPGPEPAPPAPAEQNQDVSQTQPDEKNFCETNPATSEKPASNNAETTTNDQKTPRCDKNSTICPDPHDHS